MTRLAAVLGLLVAGMLLASPDVAWARLERATCSCKDLRDLKNRQREAEYAILEYSQAILDIEADERRTGKPVMTTWDTYKGWLQPRVQRVLDELRDRGESLRAGRPDYSDTRAGTGKTGFFFCQSSVVAGSACLVGSLSRHERVHAAACSRYHWEEGNIFPLDYKQVLRLVDVAKEEILAYKAERAYIDDTLAKLRCGYSFDGAEIKGTEWPTIRTRWTGAVCGELNDENAHWRIEQITEGPPSLIPEKITIVYEGVLRDIQQSRITFQPVDHPTPHLVIWIDGPNHGWTHPPDGKMTVPLTVTEACEVRD
jgi:hypothetical protein